MRLFDDFFSKKNNDEIGKFLVDDSFGIATRTSCIVTGEVIQGNFKVNDKVKVKDENGNYFDTLCIIKGFEIHNRGEVTNVTAVKVGTRCGILIDGMQKENIKMGAILEKSI